MNKHLPYNILLVIVAAASGLMAVFNFALRQSSFSVTVGYRLPQPTPLSSLPDSPSSLPDSPSSLPDSPSSLPDSPSSLPDSPSSLPEEPIEDASFRYEEPSVPTQVWPESGADDGDVIYSVQFPLELNGATVQQLMFIPGVGNTTAQRIVQYREHLGGYTSLHQLLEIKGVGAVTFEKITAYLYLDEESADPYGELPEENGNKTGDSP